MQKIKILFFFAWVEGLVILSVSAACRFEGILFYVFYNLFYVLALSVGLPLLLLRKEQGGPEGIGIKKANLRQGLIAFVFAAASLGGQLIPKILRGETVPWRVLPVAALPLIMTTFSEELLFRGLIQLRLEKQFGSLIGVLLSGLFFALYHTGYPGFRSVEDILLLFAVGTFFGAAFTLGEHSLLVSCLVNLPNAFVTYVLKQGQFPKMTAVSSLYAGLTILAAGFFLVRRLANAEVSRL